MSERATVTDGVARARLPEVLLLCLGLALLWFTALPTVRSDGEPRYEAVRALIRGEMPDQKYSLVQPGLTVPLVQAARLFHVGSRQVITHFNIIVFLVFAYPLWARVSALYGSRVATRSLLILLGASMLPHHLQHYFGEVLSAMTITAGVLYAKERPAWAVALLALGVANSPALLVPVSLAAVVLLRNAPAVLLGAVAGALLIVLELRLKYGALMTPYLQAHEKGYATVLPYSGLPGFSYPAFFGVLSILFSFGKGLVWFVPGLLLFVDRNIRQRLRLISTPAGWALLAFGVAIVLTYSRWWAWYAGDFWGPRFFLILALPAALALAMATTDPGSRGKAAITLVVLALSAWVGVSGLVFNQDAMDICWSNNYELEFLCWYVPEFSALWRPFVTRSLTEIANAIAHSEQRFFVFWQIVTLGYLALSVVYSEVLRSRSPEVQKS